MNAAQADQALQVNASDPRFTYSQAVHVLTLMGADRDAAYRAVSYCQLNPGRAILIAGARVVYRGGSDWWHIDRHEGSVNPL